MLIILRIVFGLVLFYCLVAVMENARLQPETGDLTNAAYLAVAVVLAILNALVWAPLLGAKLSGPMTGIMTESTFVERKNLVLRLCVWLGRHGWRRACLLFCFLEGIRHPQRPAPFVIGLEQAKTGSWLEKVFAREVFRFDNIQNCVHAFHILKRRGIDPRPHHNPEINLVLLSLERSVQPDADIVKIRVPAQAPVLRRNPQIRLFEMDGIPLPEAPAEAPPQTEVYTLPKIDDAPPEIALQQTTESTEDISQERAPFWPQMWHRLVSFLQGR